MKFRASPKTKVSQFSKEAKCLKICHQGAAPNQSHTSTNNTLFNVHAQSPLHTRFVPLWPLGPSVCFVRCNNNFGIFCLKFDKHRHSQPCILACYCLAKHTQWDAAQPTTPNAIFVHMQCFPTVDVRVSAYIFVSNIKKTTAGVKVESGYNEHLVSSAVDSTVKTGSKQTFQGLSRSCWTTSCKPRTKVQQVAFEQLFTLSRTWQFWNCSRSPQKEPYGAYFAKLSTQMPLLKIYSGGSVPQARLRSPLHLL